MRRRLTIAVLAVVVVTLVLTVAGSLLLVRRAAISSAESDLTSQTQALAELLATRSAVLTDERVLAILRQVGSYDFLRPVGLSPAGQFTDLPAPLSPADLDVAALQAGQTVTGNVGSIVFVAEPVSLTVRQRQSLGAIPAADLAVLVVTRHAHDPVNGTGYFVIVAAVVLVVGAAVAAVLARRVSEPIRRALGTTEQIAAGDLDARVPVRAHDYPELVALADAINSMGDSLARARGLERQFLLSVSHDLRTPLTSIRGYAEALAEGATDDVPGAAAVIGTEARRLERLVQDLLDLARLDARRFSLDMTVVDAAQVAAGVVDAFGPEASGFAVTLRGPDRRPGPQVVADRDRLAQVVANLVENALSFATGDVTVEVGTDGGWCTVAVTDDGPGIPPGELQQVFDRHFTGERARARRRVGTGLGLAIVAELTRAMGGTVGALSPPVPGRPGTRMTVRLPCAPRPAGPPATTGPHPR